MKKVKELAIMILMITIMSILSIKVEATTGKINSETVNMRKEPNTNSTIIEQLDKNSKVEILEQENGWYKVKINEKNITGYISEKLVDVEEENPASQNNNTVTATETTPEVQPTTSENTVVETNIDTTTVETPVNEIEPTTQTVETSTEITEKSQYTLEKEIEIKAIPLVNSRSIANINGKINVLETINDWCRIENDTDTGWVRINQLKKSISDETQQPEQKVEEQPVENEQQEQEQTPTTSETPSTEETKEPEKTTPTVKTVNKTGYVDAEGLVVREEASTSSKELDCLSRNYKVDIIGEVDGWYQIKLNGKTGYVSAKYISDSKTVETTSRSGSSINPENITPMEEQDSTQNESQPATSSSTTENSGTSVVEYAKQYLGCKYVAGGSSPEGGFDCSGFTSYVYKHFGISLSRSSKGQISNGVAVEKSNLQPGDIVVFNNSSNTAIGHVGIYVGGNSFIHAANPKEGVVITSLSSSYYQKRYVGARRVK